MSEMAASIHGQFSAQPEAAARGSLLSRLFRLHRSADAAVEQRRAARKNADPTPEELAKERRIAFMRCFTGM
jgi:hypothetical protein